MFKGLLYLAILTAAIVATWIGSSVYHSYTTSTISSDTSVIITPIPQEFDREIIESLRIKKVIRADLAEDIDQTSIISEATPSGEATGSAEQQL